MLYQSLLILFLLIFTASHGLAKDNRLIIEQLGHDIQQAQDPLTKSRLHLYRARHHANATEWKKAMDDYNNALELNHKGWIHLERGRFLMATGKYKLAYEEAMATKEEMPTLSYEADKIIQKATAKLEEQQKIDNPPTIILNETVDPYRKTRFDLMRERGVYAEKANRLNQIRNRNTASNKRVSSSSKSSQPKARKS